MRVAIGSGRRIKSVDGEDLLVYTSKTEPGWSGGMIFAPRSSGGITPVLVAIHADSWQGPR